MIDGRIYATAFLFAFLFWCIAPVRGWTHRWFDWSINIAVVLFVGTLVVAALDIIWFRIG
jgi:hypothetical protein